MCVTTNDKTMINNSPVTVAATASSSNGTSAPTLRISPTTTSATIHPSSSQQQMNNCSTSPSLTTPLPSQPPRIHYHGNSRPRKPRRLKLGDEEEEIIKQEERIEFQKVLDKQIPDIDPEMIHPLKECAGKYELFGPEDTYSRSMRILLQYQSFKSYVDYSEDEEKQKQQILAQKKKRFELMKQKRAIRREKRKDHKLRHSYENCNLLSSFHVSPTTEMVMTLSSRSLKYEHSKYDKDDEDDLARESKRIKLDDRELSQREKQQLGQQAQQQQQQPFIYQVLEPDNLCSSSTSTTDVLEPVFDQQAAEEEEKEDNISLFSDAFDALIDSLPASQVSEIDLLDTTKSDSEDDTSTSSEAGVLSTSVSSNNDLEYSIQHQPQGHQLLSSPPQEQQQQFTSYQQQLLSSQVFPPAFTSIDPLLQYNQARQYCLQRCNSTRYPFLSRFGSYAATV